MERILVGVDGSAPSLKAVDLAADLASKYNAELVLLTVVPHLAPVIDPAIEEYARLEHVPASALELAVAAAEAVLDAALHASPAAGSLAARAVEPRRPSWPGLRRWQWQARG